MKELAVSFRLEKKEAKRLLRIAKKNGMSRSYLIRKALEYFLAHYLDDKGLIKFEEQSTDDSH